jgi:hypothetical protein
MGLWTMYLWALNTMCCIKALVYTFVKVQLCHSNDLGSNDLGSL